MRIVIDGNIGSGKSTVTNRVCHELRLPMFLEPVDQWNEWLSLYYKDPDRWGFSMNLNVLMSFSKWRANNNFLGLYERSPLSNRYVFTELQQLNPLEQRLYEQVYDQVAWVPDVIIYIRTDPEVSMERMQKRARDCESNVPLEYLKLVHEKYEKMFKPPREYFSYLDHQYTGGKQCRIILVDGNRDAEAVYKDVLEWVKAYKDE
jgi:deoxyadenosine/deoxycytidine kinase